MSENLLKIFLSTDYRLGCQGVRNRVEPASVGWLRHTFRIPPGNLFSEIAAISALPGALIDFVCLMIYFLSLWIGPVRTVPVGSESCRILKQAVRPDAGIAPPGGGLADIRAWGRQDSG